MHKVVNEHPEDDKNDLNVGTLLFVLPTLIWSVEKSSGFLFRNSEKEHISHAVGMVNLRFEYYLNKSFLQDLDIGKMDSQNFLGSKDRSLL